MTKPFDVSWSQTHTVRVWANDAEEAEKLALTMGQPMSIGFPEDVSVTEVIAQGEREVAEEREG